MRNAKLILLGATAALAACGGNAPAVQNGAASGAPVNNAVAPPATGTAIAVLTTADGQPAGTARVTQADGALRVSVEAQALPPGEHGVHIHMTGKCDAPEFTSAGGHWNPDSKHHGLDNPEGQHAGDMPNLTIGADGKGTLDYELKGGTLAGLFDDDGSAFVVHAGQDDQKSDPAGNSGARIACGVFRTG